MKLLSDQVDEREISIILRELRAVLDQGIPGDVVELGCYVGTTSVYLAKEITASNRQLWLYDSFEGLPEKSDKDSSPIGQQFQAGELAVTKKQLIKNFRALNLPKPRVKKAWFSELSSSDIPEQICFAFLDSDFYKSILDSLQLIWPNLTPGARFVIDDYANQALPGASHAVDEWLQSHPGRLTIEHSLAVIKL